MADTNLDTFIGWNPGQQGFTCCGLSGSMAPFVFDSQGDSSVAGRPTRRSPRALKDIVLLDATPDPPCGPTGGFVGDVRPSGDFSHYFFSSGNIAFAPGGLTSGTGLRLRQRHRHRNGDGGLEAARAAATSRKSRASSTTTTWQLPGRLDRRLATS